MWKRNDGMLYQEEEERGRKRLRKRREGVTYKKEEEKMRKLVCI